MVVSGRTYRSDLKIINGEVIPDWWRQSGHAVESGDVADILAAEPKYLVIGTGSSGLMKVSNQLRSSLQEHGIELIREPTTHALNTFNTLFHAGKNVAAGFHLTC